MRKRLQPCTTLRINEQTLRATDDRISLGIFNERRWKNNYFYISAFYSIHDKNHKQFVLEKREAEFAS